MGICSYLSVLFQMIALEVNKIFGLYISGLQLHLLPLIISLMSIHDLAVFTVQDTWNCLEDVLVNAIDKHAPLAHSSRIFSKKSLMQIPLSKAS
jgi:hypothetical protein